MGAVINSERDGPGRRKPPNDPVRDMYNLYGTSVERQAGDYEDIMGRYRDIYRGATNPTNDAYQFKPIVAEQTQYSKSPDTTAALAELAELARTGGLNEAAQQNLRARGVSPIRAQYATATRDMDRQRRLGGATSANFGAVTSKMARDQSSLIADQMDKVNAGIATMVQSGRLSAAPNYASAAQAESALEHGIRTDNTEARNTTNRFNATGQFEARGRQRSDALGAVSGMTNLYGTTPALSQLYGDQAHRTAEFTDRTNSRRVGTALDAFRSAYR